MLARRYNEIKVFHFLPFAPSFGFVFKRHRFWNRRTVCMRRAIVLLGEPFVFPNLLVCRICWTRCDQWLHKICHVANFIPTLILVFCYKAILLDNNTPWILLADVATIHVHLGWILDCFFFIFTFTFRLFCVGARCSATNLFNCIKCGGSFLRARLLASCFVQFRC